jgi:hypothetical protein
MPHAAPSRVAPVATANLDVGGPTLNLGGEFQGLSTLSTSEARIVLNSTLKTRSERDHDSEEKPITGKAVEYLELFAPFKDMADAQQIEALLTGYQEALASFERSQLGSLVPTCSDEAQALIPSLTKKIEDGIITEDDLENICNQLQRLKRQAQL